LAPFFYAISPTPQQPGASKVKQQITALLLDLSLEHPVNLGVRYFAA